MKFDLARGLEILDRTPRVLHALLGGLPESWTAPNEGPTWAAHDLGHVAQIARVMARQHRDEVGPWRAYLPIMDRS